jgi:hypothetical protein
MINLAKRIGLHELLIKDLESLIDNKKQTIDSTADDIVTLRKLLNTRIDVNTGKIIKLEIIIAPISRIPITIVKAVSTAIMRLYLPEEIPLAVAKGSSNVSANIL